MSIPVLPDASNSHVAKLNIAYNIVMNAFGSNDIPGDEGIKDYLKKITNAYVQVFSAIDNGRTVKEIDLG